MMTLPDTKVEILVVEDDPSTAALVCKGLMRKGWETKVAHTADDAIALLLCGRFALVLLDYMLEDNQSWSVLETARTMIPAVPVIVVTGRGSEQVAVEALQKGAADYVIKCADYWKNLPEVVSRILRETASTFLPDCLRMAEVSDPEFIGQLRQQHDVAFEKVVAAQKIRAESACNGIDVSIADILEMMGAITPRARRDIEEKVLGAQHGSITELGQFKLIKKLGEGGMGVVFLAEDLHIQRRVALKVLSKRHAHAEFLERFRCEAKATAKLNHINIVTAYAAGEDRGYHYLAMEYCIGESLETKLERERTLPWPQTLEIAIQVVRALQHAHAIGIVHRDIKPSNIFMTKGGVIKLLDMGLSKDIRAGERGFNTQAGVTLGTPHYISPEQATGDRVIDGRSDIYSLGATLYHLVTGYTPYEGSSSAVIMVKHVNDEFPNPQRLNPTIPDGYVDLIQRMMAKSRNDRYRNCTDVLRDLELALFGTTTSGSELGLKPSANMDNGLIPLPSHANLRSNVLIPLPSHANLQIQMPVMTVMPVTERLECVSAESEFESRPTERIDCVSQPTERLEGVSPPTERLDCVSPPTERFASVSPPTECLECVSPPTERLECVSPRKSKRSLALACN